MAIIDGNWVTAIRTAGLSAVAAKRLARPDASIAAFIGCGVQALSHLRALTEIFQLKRINVFGRGAASQNAFCRNAEKMDLSVITAQTAQTAQEAIQDADLIVTSVTLSPQLVPFLDARWLKPGAFVTMTDLAAPWLSESMSGLERIIIDDLEQEAGMPEPLVDPALVHGDLTDLVTGKTVGRQSVDERTAFVFRGLALGDLAVSGLAYQCACEQSQGTLITS
ncbi:hypothetical protein [Nitrosomonas ureae]|uniref:hypothetical protein n=1 Tax=Nitrosomonas ureae TaxID=44577 RepID=UPI001C3EF177|nr:hypothetical protein [Nitrosomonas ureae]